MSSSSGIATIEKSLEPPSEDPPLDSAWRLTIEPMAFTFACEGGFSIHVFTPLLLFNVAFVVLLSILALGLFGVDVGPWKHSPDRFWVSLLLLVVFSAIWLLLLVPLIITVLAPFSRIFWRFERARIVCNRRYAVFSRSQTWDVRRLDRLEVRRADGQVDVTNEDMGSREDELNLYDLVFLTDKQVDLCCIDFIREEEACWIAQTIYHRRPEWFRTP